MGILRRRGIIGFESHVGSGALRSVFEDDRGEGWAWRRRCERCFQVGRGTLLICDSEVSTK